ncbi:MAG: hypothetical protein H0U13_08670, partial [Gemmatimonadaceae bacterium]|nr:hypothetical protein [Gemmatimonadaceae bacterium]
MTSINLNSAGAALLLAATLLGATACATQPVTANAGVAPALAAVTHEALTLTTP